MILLVPLLVFLTIVILGVTGAVSGSFFWAAGTLSFVCLAYALPLFVYDHRGRIVNSFRSRWRRRLRIKRLLGI